ncbi:hypothetical protein BN961_02195 [Afipia felis]|uniref:Uncharacterized protein n=1 Tax=Afipia felis TaxID=1035 RepID=A0A090MN25_AFIFE|nr:hypothetical protein BN961_02195 [Afipia felis]
MGGVGLSAHACIDAHRITGIAAQHVHQIRALHHRELYRFARLVVEAIDVKLRAARQIDLAQTGGAKMQNARTERVGPAADPARDIAPVVERRDQVVAGRDVQTCGRGDVGEFCLAAGIRDDVQNQEGAVQCLDAPLVPPDGRTGGHDPANFGALLVHVLPRLPGLFFLFRPPIALRVK